MPGEHSQRQRKIARCGFTEIGLRIRAIRRSRKLTRANVAHASGLSVKSITKYEQGERLPGLVNAVKLARGLMCDLPDLCFLPLDLTGKDFEALPVAGTGSGKLG